MRPWRPCPFLTSSTGSSGTLSLDRRRAALDSDQSTAGWQSCSASIRRRFGRRSSTTRASSRTVSARAGSSTESPIWSRSCSQNDTQLDRTAEKVARLTGPGTNIGAAAIFVDVDQGWEIATRDRLRGQRDRGEGPRTGTPRSSCGDRESEATPTRSERWSSGASARSAIRDSTTRTRRRLARRCSMS